MWDAEPNAGHRALADLESRTALHTLVTQNIDGLHQRAGSSPEIVIEIHGTAHEAKCLDCGWRGPMQETLDRVRAGEDDPPCLVCGGMLKSGTISFGESLVEADLVRAQQAAAGADVFLAVGTSLGVYPAAALPEIALHNGARLVILNAEPTPFDERGRRDRARAARHRAARHRRGRAGPSHVVNFVGHIAIGVTVDGSRADTEFLLGTALPDFAAMARLKLDRTGSIGLARCAACSSTTTPTRSSTARVGSSISSTTCSTTSPRPECRAAARSRARTSASSSCSTASCCAPRTPPPRSSTSTARWRHRRRSRSTSSTARNATRWAEHLSGIAAAPRPVPLRATPTRSPSACTASRRRDRGSRSSPSRSPTIAALLAAVQPQIAASAPDVLARVAAAVR